jgi:hypothetical protein
VELTAVVGTVGGIIAAASSISAVAALFDTRQRARLADAQLALEVQRAATEREVIEMLLRAADWAKHRTDAPLEPAEQVRLESVYSRGKALLDLLENERGGRGPKAWMRGAGSLAAVIAVAREANEALQKELVDRGMLGDPAESDGRVAGVSAITPASTPTHALFDQLAALAVRHGLSEKKATSAYVPFGPKDSKKHLVLLTPRSLHVNARFRVPESTEVDGFDVTNYSNDGFYSIRLTQADLDERSDAVEALVRQAAATTELT